MSTEYGFSFVNDKCIQCYGCEVACKAWRNSDLGIRKRRVQNIWIGRFPEVKNTTASVSCMHCADPACVKSCPVGALTKRSEDGIVLVDSDKCIGCRTCLQECPFGAPQFAKSGKMQKCDLCLDELNLDKEQPPCVETCPTKALKVGKMSKGEKMVAEAGMLNLMSKGTATR
jgi:anaerobic dimethyl sulfoxide reductase subunit B